MLTFETYFSPGAITGEEKTLFLKKVETVLTELKVFIFQTIFSAEPISFDEYQLEETQCANLTKALEKISIGDFTPFEKDLVRQLESEKDDLSPLELMVEKSFYPFPNLIIILSLTCSLKIPRRCMHLSTISAEILKVRPSNASTMTVGISVTISGLF